MKNSAKRRIPKIWIVLAIVLAVIILAFSTLSICFDAFGNYKATSETVKIFDYNMREIFKNNGDTLVTDIAMLGSHDAFSNAITKYSQLDPAEKSAYMAFPIVRQITSHFSKAQTEGANIQLYRGVRYFDIRLSKIDKKVFSKHVFISEEIEHNLDELINFAERNKGEVIILDFQHIFLDNGNVEELFEVLAKRTNSSAKNIFDYVHYEPSKTPLSKLTYNDVTKNGTQSGFVILMKEEVLDKENVPASLSPNFVKFMTSIYPRDNSIISTWHNKLSDEDMFKGIDAELLRLKTAETNGVFVVNQAQKTPAIAPQNVFLNLLTLADEFNFKHLARANFVEQLDSMPIFMVDNATTSAHNFNYDAMSKIFNYNMNLKKA